MLRIATVTVSVVLLCLGSPPALAEHVHDHAEHAQPKPAAKEKHSHHSAHGGQVGMWKDWHLEVAETPEGEVRVWLTDEYRDPVPLEGVGGTVTVLVDDDPVEELPLTVEDGVLLARGTAQTVQHETEVRITGLAEDVFMSFIFVPELPKDPHYHEHSSHHGGQVGMIGEYHIEVRVPESGHYQVFPTDAYRKPLDLAEVSGKVVVTAAEAQPLELALSPDAKGTCLEARGEPLKGTFMVEVVLAGLGEKETSMEFQFQVD